MSEQEQPESLFNEDHEATYCPEDNKLRLYVGRVPKEEYLSLRAEGWKASPKQDCDFVATWTPKREDTATDYAGTIGDEDQGPEDRAADRAERFAGYRDKRTGEALSHADSYDSGPSAHGFQSKAKAVKAADRHDKQAFKALTQWDKASYWTSRTAGVISNAMYLSRPYVRMGRIKKLETEERRLASYTHENGTRWHSHYVNRIAYEEAMLEAVGGRAAVVTMEKGGTYAGLVITRVVISKASGNATSLKVIIDGKESLFNIEREEAGRYEAPTEESAATLKQFLKDRAAAAKVANAGKPKLINPSLEDAEKLQEKWNSAARRMSGDKATDQTVYQMTQAHYSRNSGGDYAHFSTIKIKQGGAEQYRQYYTYSDPVGNPSVCKIREARSESTGWTHGSARRVIHITDKPAKALPAATWEAPIPLTKEEKTMSFY
tara:strand:+ start:3089 stop:4390 length:1302 start_codon:yes stop_codon:yes gene_type:complete